MNIILLYVIILLLLLSLGGNINKVTTSLIKPSIYPPNYLFGLMWSILFIIFPIFLYYSSYSLQIIGLVYFSLVLLWTPLFSYTESTLVGFIYLLFVFILTILLLTLSITVYHNPYSWLLIPQLLWVGFATLISYFLYKLN